MRSALRVKLVVAALLAVAPSAAASPADDSEALIKRGNELRRRGDDMRALPEFEKAYALVKSPRAAAQLGLCEFAVGRFADAETHLLDALSARQDVWIQKNRTTLEDSLIRIKQQVGRVEVIGDPVGAMVIVNGRQVGTLPLAAPVAVNVGAVQVEATASGHERQERQATVAAGKIVTVVLRLKPIAVSIPTVAATPEPPSPAAASLGERAEPGEPAPYYKRVWFWGVVGTVVAGAIVASVIATSGTSEAPAPNGEGRLR